MSITVIGTIFIDIKGHPFDAFIPDGRNAGYVEYVHGGVGRNIAEDLAVLGEKPLLVSVCDPGGAGDEVLAHLEAAGVDTHLVGRVSNGSGTWLAVFDEKGDVVSSISARADLSSLASIIDAHHEEIFSQADLVVLEMDIDTEAVRKTFEYAQRYHTRVCCAVATMSQALDKREFIRSADLFICNQQEAGMLMEEDVTACAPAEVLEKARRHLRETGLKSLVVTMSHRGSVFVDADGREGVCPALPAQALDSTGAGDSYCAGLCAALARGRSLESACAVGARVASSVVASSKNVYSGPAFEELG